MKLQRELIPEHMKCHNSFKGRGEPCPYRIYSPFANAFILIFPLRLKPPPRAYFNSNGKLKLEIGLGKGKKLYDKRADIKEKTVLKKLDRVMKSRRD